MGSPITTDAATSLDTLLVHHRDRRRRLATIERDSTVGRDNTAEHSPGTGPDAGPIPSDDDSALSRILEVRNGHRAMGRARGRHLQTSLIFQALLVLATVLGVVAIVQYRSAPAGGSPDAEPPSVLVQLSE